MHREGFVVEFEPQGSSAWIGNFQPGLTSTSQVSELGPDEILVVAGGQAYVVSPNSGELLRCFGGQLEAAYVLNGRLLLSNGLWLELHHGMNLLWRSRRISWDGMRNLKVDELSATGEAWRYDETWHQFSANLESGYVLGGAYDGPEP